MRTALKFLVVAFIALVALELGARILLSRLGTHYSSHYALLNPKQLRGITDFIEARTWARFHAQFGWDLPLNKFDQPFRSNRPYSKDPAPGVLRVMAVGDSFTYGDEVELTESWPYLFEQLRNSTECLNYGVPAYGLDQTLLRFRTEGRAYKPDIVIVGFISDMIPRNVNTFRPFLQRGLALPLAKPRFRESDGTLQLIPPPIKSVAEYRELLSNPLDIIRRTGADYFGPFYETAFASTLFSKSWLLLLIDEALTRNRFAEKFSTEAVQITERLVVELTREIKGANGLPLYLFFPTTGELVDHERAQNLEQMMVTARAAGAYVLDLRPHLRNVKSGNLFQKRGHYTPDVHGIIARQISVFFDANPELALASQRRAPP